MAKKFKPKQYTALSSIPIRSKRTLEDEHLTSKNVGRGKTVTVTGERMVSGVLYGQIGDNEFVVLTRPGYTNFREV
jgi:hypothetical protein